MSLDLSKALRHNLTFALIHISFYVKCSKQRRVNFAIYKRLFFYHGYLNLKVNQSMLF